MATASAARRINRLLAAAVVGITGAAAASALLGERVPADDGRGVTTTTIVLAGPADTDGSWFAAPAAGALVDYPLGSLTCAAIEEQFTPDLCAVAVGNDGSRSMVVGHEGYWSPDEPDPDGKVRIPFDVAVYALADSEGTSVARAVLTANIALPYGEAYDELSLHKVRVGTAAEGETLVLVWSERDTLQSPALDGVQVISLSGRAPRVVATERGTDVVVGTDGGDLALVMAKRGPVVGDQLAGHPLTLVTLRPGATWSRRINESVGGSDLDGFVASERLDSYGFPRRR